MVKIRRTIIDALANLHTEREREQTERGKYDRRYGCMFYSKQMTNETETSQKTKKQSIGKKPVSDINNHNIISFKHAFINELEKQSIVLLLK